MLDHAGKVTHDEAVAKAKAEAKAEYGWFAQARAELPTPVERHFDEAVKNVKGPADKVGKHGRGGRGP
jgi:hypothetical protein